MGVGSKGGLARLIGIVGGTFDPIHYGHLCPVHRLTQELDFLKVHYVLSARPPHRSLPVASIAHRYNMLALALDVYPEFVADDQETQRLGPSFTLWTIRQLRQRYGNDPLCLIMGMDAYRGLHLWYRWQDIVALANIVVLSRQGWEPDESNHAGDAEDLRRKGSGVVMFAESLEIPITATDIRNKLGQGEDVSNEVPAKVLEYIQKNEIYGAKESYE